MLIEKIHDRTAKICIMGLGYVGLPTAIHFCEQGFNVIGIDIDAEKVAKLSKAEFPTDDRDLRLRLKKTLNDKKLKITDEFSKSIKSSDIIIVIVPTPITKTKDPDLSYIISASQEILKGLKKNQLIVLESTTFPGTTEDIVKPILEQSGLKAGKDFGLAYCPERYNPGDKEHTIEQVSRIVGGINLKWARTAKELYQAIIQGDILVVEDIRTAEAAKVIENIQRDLNIALFNELAMIFQKMGINAISVIDAASTKWNFMKLYPGPGVGGHCLPVDPYYLTHKAKELGYHPKLILAGRSINDNMPYYVVDLIIDGLNDMFKPVKGSKIAVLGVSYKANTGDLRESPALTIIDALSKMKAQVYVHDPYVQSSDVKKALKLKNYKLKEALKDSDCVVLHTYHDDFMEIDLAHIKKLAKKDVLIVDTRHVFSPKEVKKAGMHYRGIGQGGV